MPGLFLLPVSLGVLMLRAAVAAWAWNVFAEQMTGVHLTLVHMLAALIAVGVFKKSRASDFPEDGESAREAEKRVEKAYELLAIDGFYALFAWGSLWLLHQWVQA